MSALALAAKSASRSARSYSAHTAAVALNAFVYYLFASVKLDPVVEQGVLSKMGMSTAFKAASVVVVVFAAVFLWFASAYFLRRRKREAGLYALFGAPKAAIALGLFAESAIMGLAAASAGIALGAVFSRLFLLAVFRLVAVDAAPTAFLNLSAVVETGIVFACLVAFASLGSFLVVFKYRLSELFGAAREAERMPGSSIALAAASVVLLLAGYVLALSATMRTVSVRFLVVAAMTTVSTYGIVRFFLPAALRAVRSDPRLFMRSWRPIAIGNLAFRIGNNVRVFFAIAMVGTVSMVAIGTGLNVKYDTIRRAESEFPFSYSFTDGDGSAMRKVLAAIEADGAHPVTASAGARHVTALATVVAAPGDAGREMKVDVIGLSEYRAARFAVGRLEERAWPGPGEAFVVLTRTDRLSEAEGARLSFAGGAIVTVAGTVRGSAIGGWASRTVLVVPDDEFASIASAHPEGLALRRGVKVEDDRNAAALSAAIMAAIPDADPSSYDADVLPLLRSNDLFLFIGVFIGLVFLASTGSVIHFKHVMEVSDDADRYRFLTTIGAERAVLEKAVRRQVLAVYLAPLVLGVCHSVVALATMGRVFQSDFSRPIAFTIAAYCAAYSALYALTARASVAAGLGARRA